MMMMDGGNNPSKRRMSMLALDELKRREDLESLRKYLIAESCFPAQRDPNTASITMEELKKLARIWKLNERRNFWKTHTDRDEIVATLLHHARQNKNFITTTTKKSNNNNNNNMNNEGTLPPTLPLQQQQQQQPVPPSDYRPTSATGGILLRGGGGGGGGSIRNFYGLKYFNRENNPIELVIASRFFTFPNTDDDSIDKVVDRWRSEDFNMKDDSQANANTGGTNTNPPSNRNSAVLPNTTTTTTTTTSGVAGGGGVTTNSQQGSGSNNTMGGSNKETISSSTTSSPSSSHRHLQGIRNKVKLMKQRNLAMHLMNYSAHIDFKKTTLNVKIVQTFINVAESDDPKTVSHCMIALSNIAMDIHVRSILFEINAIHKITNMLNYIRGKAAIWAAGLLFYYFSIDKEAEDRVYNASIGLLQSNGMSKDIETRTIALYTLNNLMPCIDRQRVAETIMRILLQHFDTNSVLKDKSITSNYLMILLNMSWFTNAHTTLINCNILDLLAQFASYASEERNAEIGSQVAKILISFLQLPEQAANLVTIDFVTVLTSLIHDTMPDHPLNMALKASVLLSSYPSLRRIVRESSLTETIANMVIKKGINITNPIAKDCAKYFSNMTHSEPPLPSFMLLSRGGGDGNTTTTTTRGSAGDNGGSSGNSNDKLHPLEMLVDSQLPEAIFSIMKAPQIQISIKSTVVHALQNIVSYMNNAVRLTGISLEPILKFLKDSHDLGAAQVLYNLSCVPLCRADLVSAKVHCIILEHFQNTKDSNTALKSVFLQILVQLSSSDICVMELLHLDLIAKLEIQLKGINKMNINWKDISLMLLAVVAYAIKSIPMTGLMTIVRILRIICIKEIESEIIENCANIVKLISAYFSDFNELNPVIRAILAIQDNEEITDCISTVLYNMTCYNDNILLMLTDNTYLNVMIRLMRNGKAEVQENIIQAISTLCSNEKCTELLLKYDILSDLIVIALLRTSSEEIKVICSQAFYNMLCHNQTRLDLVKGDLWWALMRLGRTNSRTVQSICIRALCDLSYPPMETSGTSGSGSNAVKAKVSNITLQAQYQRIQALRKHNILSFMRDLSITAHAEELLTCMQILHNLLYQFIPMESLTTTSTSTTTTSTTTSMANNNRMVHDFTEIEIIAAIRITADAIARANNLKTIRIALLVMLKCAQQLQMDKIFTEFLNIDVLEILKIQCRSWNRHPDCRLNVSRLLYELSKSKIFTKASSVIDINTIAMAMVDYAGDNNNTTGTGTTTSSDSKMLTNSIEIIENIAATFLQFTISENISPYDLITLSIWPILLKEGLSLDSTVLSNRPGLQSLIQQFNTPLPGRRAMGSMIIPNSSSGSSSGMSSPMKPVTVSSGSTTATTIPSSATTPATTTTTGGGGGNSRKSIFMREVSMTNTNATDLMEALKGPTANAFRVQGITLALLAYTIDALLSTPNGLEQLTSSLLQGLLKTDLIDHIWTRNNLLTILHATSQSQHCIPALLSPDTFMLLLRYLNSSIGTIRQEKAQEFSACFLRNLVLHSALVSRLIAISHGALNDFVREVCDELQSLEAAFDLSIFFFHTANYLVQNEGNLNPRFVLEMITSISTNEKLALMDNNNNNNNNNTANNSVKDNNTISSNNGSGGNNNNNEIYLNINNINKYTLSMILSKYSFTQGVDPSFIQNMLSYMQSSAILLIPDLMRTIEFKTIPDWKSQLMIEFLQVKESVYVDLLVFFPDQPIWQPVCHTTCKFISSVILKFTQPNSVIYDKLENVEALPTSLFSKVVHSFDPVQEGGKGDNQAITEAEDSEGEGKEEEDDDDHDHDHHEEEDDDDDKADKDDEQDDDSNSEKVNNKLKSNRRQSGGDSSDNNNNNYNNDSNGMIEITGSIRNSMGNAILASAMNAMRIVEADEEEQEQEGQQQQQQQQQEPSSVDHLDSSSLVNTSSRDQQQQQQQQQNGLQSNSISLLSATTNNNENDENNNNHHHHSEEDEIQRQLTMEASILSQIEAEADQQVDVVDYHDGLDEEANYSLDQKRSQHSISRLASGEESLGSHHTTGSKMSRTNISASGGVGVNGLSRENSLASHHSTGSKNNTTLPVAMNHHHPNHHSLSRGNSTGGSHQSLGNKSHQSLHSQSTSQQVKDELDNNNGPISSSPSSHGISRTASQSNKIASSSSRSRPTSKANLESGSSSIPLVSAAAPAISVSRQNSSGSVGSRQQQASTKPILSRVGSHLSAAKSPLQSRQVSRQPSIDNDVLSPLVSPPITAPPAAAGSGRPAAAASGVLVISGEEEDYSMGSFEEVSGN